MATQEEKQQHQREARALLEGFWPEGFSFSAPKPLKIGITDDLVADAERRGLPFTREEIKAAVRLYAESYGYVLAMSEGPEVQPDRGSCGGNDESRPGMGAGEADLEAIPEGAKRSVRGRKTAKPSGSKSGA